MAESSAEMRSKSPSVVVQVLLVLLFVMILFSVLEFGLHSLSVVQALVNRRSNQGAFRQLADHPYLTTVLKPSLTTILPDYPEGGDLVFTTDSRGFRTPEFTSSKPESTFRIVVLGGSTVVAAQTNDQTFPALLQDQLNASSSRTIEVINAGVPTWTSTQELFLLATEVLNWEPDLVIVYDGRNDLHYGVLPNAEPNLLPRASQQMAYLEDYQDPWRRNFMTYYLIDTRVIHPRDLSNQQAEISNPDGIPVNYALHQNIIETYARNLDSMSALLTANGVETLMVFQPNLLTTNKPLTAYEQTNLDALQSTYTEAMLAMLREAAIAAEQVAQQRNVQWADFSGVFDDEASLMLLDDVHQSNAGNTVLAQKLSEIIAPMIP